LVIFWSLHSLQLDSFWNWVIRAWRTSKKITEACAFGASYNPWCRT
jgi:hypothetical protein